MATATESSKPDARPLKPRPSIVPELLTQTEARALVGISNSTWHRMRAAGELPDPVYLPTRRAPMWRRGDLLRWLDSLGSKRK